LSHPARGSLTNACNRNSVTLPGIGDHGFKARHVQGSAQLGRYLLAGGHDGGQISDTAVKLDDLHAALSDPTDGLNYLAYRVPGSISKIVDLVGSHLGVFRCQQVGAQRLRHGCSLGSSSRQVSGNQCRRSRSAPSSRLSLAAPQGLARRVSGCRLCGIAARRQSISHVEVAEARRGKPARTPPGGYRRVRPRDWHRFVGQLRRFRCIPPLS
jgi:hypothetical protein